MPEARNTASSIFMTVPVHSPRVNLSAPVVAFIKVSLQMGIACQKARIRYFINEEPGRKPRRSKHGKETEARTGRS